MNACLAPISAASRRAAERREATRAEYLDALAAVHAGTQTSKRDLTLVLSAVGAIFAGLIGTNVLDTGTSAHYMEWADHTAVVLWLPALLLLAVCAYKSPAETKQLREGAWVATAVAGVVTAVVLLLTGFGFTRDTDHVRLMLTKSGVTDLQALCGPVAVNGHVDGTIRTKTLQEEFVIFDFKHPMTCEHSVDIPRGDIADIQEDP
jgi:hypothetical protein